MFYFTLSVETRCNSQNYLHIISFFLLLICPVSFIITVQFNHNCKQVCSLNLQDTLYQRAYSYVFLTGISSIFLFFDFFSVYSLCSLLLNKKMPKNHIWELLSAFTQVSSLSLPVSVQRRLEKTWHIHEHTSKNKETFRGKSLTICPKRGTVLNPNLMVRAFLT